MKEGGNEFAYSLTVSLLEQEINRGIEAGGIIEEENKEGVSICISKLSLLVPAKANII